MCRRGTAPARIAPTARVFPVLSPPKLIAHLLLALLLVSGSVAPAAAESFFSKLFGWGAPVGNAERSAISRAPARTQHSRETASEIGRERDPDERRGGSKIRTMCVRLCDGYYFPISHSTSVRQLRTDSNRCKSSCNGEGRLFYTDADNTDHASMIDFTGRRYDALKSAFAYRKALQPGCACKPAPWSAAERMRHMTYALNDAARQARERAVAEARAAADGNGRSTHAGGEADDTLSATVSGRKVVAGLRPTTHDNDTHESETDETGLTPTQAPVQVPVPVMGWSGQDRSAAGNETDEDDDIERPRRTGNHGGVVRRGRGAGAPRAAVRRPEQQARPHRSAPPQAAAAAGGGLFGFAGGKPQVWPGDRR